MVTTNECQNQRSIWLIFTPMETSELQIQNNSMRSLNFYYILLMNSMFCDIWSWYFYLGKIAQKFCLKIINSVRRSCIYYKTGTPERK